MPSSEAAAAILIGRGITPLQIDVSADSVRIGAAFGLMGDAPMSTEELQLFSRQLHAMVKGGLPIMRALASMQESATRPGIARLLADLCSSLDKGRELSTALARHPRNFPPLYVAMVRVGEQTGRLDEILKRLASWLEFERKSRERVSAALRYPMFVIVAMAIALVIVNMFVIPRFAGVYKSMNVELPWMTRLLIGFSDLMVSTWPLMLGAAFASVVLFRLWRRSSRGAVAWDAFTLRLPVAGRILRHAALARFARSLSMGLRSGVPASQAAQLVASTVGNAFMAQRFERVRSGIERGESLLRACAATRVFTPMVLQMVSVGEESGTLDEMLEHVADFYEQDVDYDLQRLSAAIEPILIVMLGIVVLILALGVFLPIWDLGKTAIGRA